LGFVAWTVFTNHYPALFIGGFLFFMGFMEATQHHQSKLSLKTPLLVGFFLAGLVVHGRCQAWWIEPLLTSAGLSPTSLLLGSAFLTSFNDNAAITYLAAQAPSLTDFAKYAVVAGAISAGGLTVIANAPNPAGQSILGKHFASGVSPMKLGLAALVPTIISIILLLVLRSPLMH
jgi:Na+/H+ antiporter NhaD/arsenite permease-like protein